MINPGAALGAFLALPPTHHMSPPLSLDHLYYPGVVCVSEYDVDRFVGTQATWEDPKTPDEMSAMAQKSGIRCQALSLELPKLPPPHYSFTYAGKYYEVLLVSINGGHYYFLHTRD